MPEGDRITGMWLDGVADRPGGAPTRSSANSFIATGGDNFRALTLGTDKQDTGFTDLQATVDYLDESHRRATRRCRSTTRQHGVGARVAGRSVRRPATPSPSPSTRCR